MRPILRPGSHVLRRGDGELQIGLDPRTAVVLPDDEEVRGCLDRLSRQAELREYADRRTLDLLEANGLLLDAGTLPSRASRTARSPIACTCTWKPASSAACTASRNWSTERKERPCSRGRTDSRG